MSNVLKTFAIASAFVVSIFTQNTSVGEVQTEKVTSNDLVKMVPIQEYKTESFIELTEEEIELIALITMAEAESECTYGKRLVIDTILNRVNSEYFPNTVEEVIYQPYHFESVWNGRVDRCFVDEDICELVREEMKYLTNEEVMYFCAGDYSKYGTPLFQVERHYFSSYQ